MQVLPKLIGPRQNGFMPKKSVQEPTVLATHLIVEANSNKKGTERSLKHSGHFVAQGSWSRHSSSKLWLAMKKLESMAGKAFLSSSTLALARLTLCPASSYSLPLSPLEARQPTTHQSCTWMMKGSGQVPSSLLMTINYPWPSPTHRTYGTNMNSHNTYTLISGLGVNLQKTAALYIKNTRGYPRGHPPVGHHHTWAHQAAWHPPWQNTKQQHQRNHETDC